MGGGHKCLATATLGEMWKFSVGVWGSQDPYELIKHPLSLERCQMAVLEGFKDKFSTFWGIETPTHFQE